MEGRFDFLEWLGPDTSWSVFMRLDDPADLVRVCAVSRSWRQFAIANGFSKSLCLRICPEISNFTRVTEVSSLETAEVGSSSAMEWESLEREHRVYTRLHHCVVSPDGRRDCILQAIRASSTDNYPDESIDNTLEPSDRVDIRYSYWSSRGEQDPSVPETLTYRLCSKLCVIDEIKIQPFKALFQNGDPIYSAKFVRFRMGYSRSLLGTKSYMTEQGQNDPEAADDDYIWTYISPEFQMLQESVLQSFKLPRPVICIGGIVQIELLGRVQKQAMDDLYYVCVCHVQVIGYLLSPIFNVDVLQAEGNLVLKYLPDARDCCSDESRESSPWHAFAARVRRFGAGGGWNQAFLETLLRPVQVEGEDESDDEIVE